MTDEVTLTLAVLGVAGQLLLAAVAVAALLRLAGTPGPLRWVREVCWGYELWLAFLVSAIATAAPTRPG